MARTPLYDAILGRLTAAWRDRAVSLKAVSFAMIGVANTVVDYGVFLLARAALSGSSAAARAIDAIVAYCHCGNDTSVSLIVANLISWIVAVTGSYILNSSITFAAESGRILTWRAYGTFLASGIVGWLANTATLLVGAQILLLPVWMAKAIAILASFAVNFSLSHFVVFRPRKAP
jgi:putative flippase GtrA